MNLALLQQLRNHGICIYLEGDKLKTKSRKNAMTKSLAQQIRAAKDELVALLGDIQPQGVDSGAVEAQLEYHKQQLKNLPPLHQLPIDSARGAINQGISAQLEHPFCARLWSSLKAKAAQLDVPIATVLNSVFAAWILRWSHQEDVVFATTVNDRCQPASGYETAEQAAYFQPLLPLRIGGFLDRSFELEVSQMSQLRGRLQQNASLCFEVLQGLLSRVNSDSYSALCQLALSVCDVEVGPLAQLRHQQFKRLGFDLGLHIEPLGDEGIAHWSYNPNLFNPSSVKRFAESFNALLQGACDDAKTLLGDLPLLGQSERSQIIAVQQAQASFEHGPSLHQAFEQAAKQYPDNIAVEFDGEAVSYAELDRRANRLAHSLLDKGVKNDELIGLCVERSLNSMIGILGILKAGGAYLPLDPGYPDDRLQYLVDDSQVRLVLTDEHTDGAPYLAGKQVERLDLVVSNRAYDDRAPNVEVKPEHLAYVIYTSGSTGNPKGVMIEHRHVLRLMRACETHFDFNAEQVWSVFHSFSFDFSVWEMWGALLYGGKAVVVPRHVARYPESFYELVVQSRVTVLSQTPSAFEQFVACDSQMQSKLALQYVVFGGEALNLQSLSSWTARHGDALPALINMYGITETTVHVTFRQIRQADIDAGRGSLIGQPLGDLSGWVLDNRQQPVPFGAVGEMYVGGAGVARGYLNRPELSAERFIDHPLCPQGKLYRTGDLVRRFEDGELAYLGRIDHQVKLRGFRIELGEIETKITQSEVVERGFVMMRGQVAAEKQLVGYFTKAAGISLDDAALQSQLRRELAAALPDYMVPTAFVRVDVFPLTVNGKIDKAQLPEPVFGANVEAYVAPEGELQQALCEVWAQTLGLDRVGMSDDFFALGGDSMSAIPLVARMKAAGLSVGIKDLYACPNLSALMALDDPVGEARLPDVPPFFMLNDKDKTFVDEQYQNGELVDAYPMTELQQGMIAQNLLSGELGTYHDVLGYHIGTSFELEHFTAALQTLTDQHEILRTLFSLNRDHALQLVLKNYSPEILVKDISHLDQDAQDLYIEQWIAQEKVKLFDMNAPVWNVHIHIRSSTSFQYHLNFNHALLDGWSVAAFNYQLFHDFMDHKEHKPIGEAPNALPYKYNVWYEQSALQDDKIAQFWQEKLQEAQLPWWSGRPRVGFHSKTLQIRGEQALAVARIAKAHKVTEKSVILASYLFLMSMLNGKKDVTSSVVVNTRPEFVGSENTLGLFLNSLPFRLNLHAMTWRELITQTHAQAQLMQQVKHYPLPMVAQLVGQDFSGSVFNFVEFHAFEGVEQRVPVIDGSAFDQNDYLFSVEVLKKATPESAIFEVRFTVEQNIFPEEFINRIVHYYERIIDSLSGEQPGILHNGDFISDVEKHTLLSVWNDTFVDFGDTGLIHNLIEAQVAKTPDAVAAVFEGQTMSYGELNARANRLAHYLVGQGVKPETPVGLCLYRSLDMVVAIIAVLKAGGAYVPLEPSMPAERLAFMMNDSSLSQVVCQRSSILSLPEHPATRLVLDDESFIAQVASQSDANLDSKAQGLSEDNLAYIFYTSGSTGNPKGVMCRHRGMLNRMCWGQRKYKFTSDDVFLQKTPYTFDISICEFMAPLMCGARIALPKADGHKDPYYLLEMMKREKVTIAHFVPSLLATFLAAVDISECESLRLVVNGGEEMSKELNDRFFATGTNSAYHNLYGPTEAAIESSYWHCSPDSEYPFVPIGKPIDNTQLYVLNSEMELLPAGVEGELHIGGAGLARGYLNLPDKTASVFVDNPFSADHKDKLYKTGDLARFLPDGNVQYLGRLDDQVKINGLRIELGEIKSRLLQLPEVKETVVMAHRDGTSDRLLAYVVPVNEVPEAEHSSFISTLKADLRAHLPLYMIPSLVTVMSRFPLLPNGKVNKRALPEPNMQVGQSYVAPSTETEKMLAALWQRLLSLEHPISATAGFFELGGQSLLAIRLISDINERMGVLVPFAELFENQYLHQLAALIDRDALRSNMTFDDNDDLADNETELLL